MLCPNCKNPNDQDASICQWCGARCAPEPPQPINPEGKTLKQLIREGNSHIATRIYIEETGATVREAQKHIEKIKKRVQEKQDDKSFWKYMLIFTGFLGLIALIMYLFEVQ